MCTQYTSLVSPFLDLPSDIFYEIFTEACKDNFDNRQEFNKLTTSSLTLGSVCKKWRDVVWSIPQLRSIIILRLSSKRSTVQLELLDLWLMNSGSCPLSIYFDVEDRKFGWRTAVGPALAALKKIIDHCERWESLDICIINDPKGAFLELLGEVKGRLPLLRTLHLAEPNNEVTAGHLLQNRDMFAIAPKLRTFSTPTPISHFLRGITLPWSQITSIHARTGTGPSMLDSIKVLRFSTNLVRCHYFSTFYHFDVFGAPVTISFIGPPSSAIVHYHLTTLKVTEIEGSDMVSMLALLRCPALRELYIDIKMSHLRRIRDIEIVHEIADEIWCKIGDFLKRSECPLEVLELEGTLLTHSISTLLEDLPALRKLSLRDKGVIEEDEPGIFPSIYWNLDFRQHRFEAPKKTFLPELQEFHYVGQDIYCAALHMPMFLEMLQKRWNMTVLGVSRLEIFTAKMDIWYDERFAPTSEVIEGFKKLVHDGMRISIQTPTGEELLDTNFPPALNLFED
ncbi:hypothetical protein BDQ17DRAFT_1430802 [Cyathus striatus]|nr:hypothetical protein BDQ17DRAFT_1430802 [Cyathus striatus]